MDPKCEIENIIENLCINLLENSISFPQKSGDNSTLHVSPPDDSGIKVMRKWTFPSNRPSSRKRGRDCDVHIEPATLFGRSLGVLDQIHKALTDNIVITKRDIYYSNPQLYKTQSIADRLIDEWALVLHTSRSELNVVSGLKGIAQGYCTIETVTGEVISFLERPQTIPDVKSISKLDISADYILVIEKEASFQYLSSCKFFLNEPQLGQGFIITAKGYPDMNTREFLNKLSNTLKNHKDVYLRSTPLYALVDFDPDGLQIFQTYKFGSKRLQHENHKLIVPELVWLGPKSNDVFFKRDFQEEQKSISLLDLTKRDMKMALKLLSKKHDTDFEIQKELKTMIFVQKKAEIQAISQNSQKVAAAVASDGTINDVFLAWLKHTLLVKRSRFLDIK